MSYNNGLTLCKTAEQLEKNANWHDSLEHYVKGLTILLDIYKNDKVISRKKRMYDLINNYFTKAERVKTLLNMETEDLIQKLPAVPNNIEEKPIPIKTLKRLAIENNE